jgi:hypothetical protein
MPRRIGAITSYSSRAIRDYNEERLWPYRSGRKRRYQRWRATDTPSPPTADRAAIHGPWVSAGSIGKDQTCMGLGLAVVRSM